MTVFLFLLTVLIWGSTFYAIALQLGDVPPLQSVFYRFALAAAIMWLITLFKKPKIHFSRDIHILLGVLGLLLFSLNYIIVYIATQYLVSGLVSIIFSMLLIFNTLFYWIFLKEKPSLGLIAGCLLGLCGITALFVEDVRGTQLNGAVLLGVVLSLISTLSAAGGNIVARLLQLRNVDVMTSNTWGMTYGTLILFVAVLVHGEPLQFSTKPGYILSFLHLTIAGTVIAFWTYLTLIQRIGAPRAAYISVLFPIVALLLSTFFEDLIWTLPKITGVVLILAGNIFIIQRKRTV